MDYNVFVMSFTLLCIEERAISEFTSSTFHISPFFTELYVKLALKKSNASASSSSVSVIIADTFSNPVTTSDVHVSWTVMIPPLPIS